MSNDRILPHNGRPPNRLELFSERLGSSRAGGWIMGRFGYPVDRWLLRRTKGKRALFSSMIPTLLLVTTGARSGAQRQTPLVYVSNGDSFVVIASNFGNERHPAWYHNLKAHPDAEVYAGGEHHFVRAREVHGDERDRLWEHSRDAYRGYDTYVDRAGERTIPMLVLQPRS